VSTSAACSCGARNTQLKLPEACDPALGHKQPPPPAPTIFRLVPRAPGARFHILPALRVSAYLLSLYRGRGSTVVELMNCKPVVSGISAFCCYAHGFNGEKLALKILILNLCDYKINSPLLVVTCCSRAIILNGHIYSASCPVFSVDSYRKISIRRNVVEFESTIKVFLIRGNFLFFSTCRFLLTYL
jgi:hypothetical protein